MIDLDDFKEINDTYSHTKGDQVLQEVAGIINESTRESDTVFRYGGDEFLILLPETNGGTEEVVHRLQEILHKWNKRSDFIDFELTMAIGTSYWNPQGGKSMEEVINLADERMYKSKNRS